MKQYNLNADEKLLSRITVTGFWSREKCGERKTFKNAVFLGIAISDCSVKNAEHLG